MEENGTIFVRTRYVPEIPFNIHYAASQGNTKPSWIDQPPGEISDYITGIGYANPRSYYRDTITASYEAAIYAIIQNVSAAVISTFANSKDTLETFSSMEASTSNTVSASAALKGFYVLETWFDPASRGIWTLAIVREALAY
jgi:hypothetical protein